MAALTGLVAVGNLGVICPECEAEIPVSVSARLSAEEADAQVTLICEPDLTDLWAHMWTHSAVG